MSAHYKKAGVDNEAGDALIDWLQADRSEVPHKNRIVEGIGGFASLFRIDFPEMKKPCLITCTDGVGTKVKLAAHFERYEGIGQDLVGMCVNDLICTGGRPLLFLDYYATGKLDLKAAQSFLLGLKKACHEADCALVGGETAEMPGVYQEKDFDVAGFAVGIVDEDQRLGPQRVREGDAVIGVSSSGFHSNGYSLLRKVFAEDLALWKDELLKPTALYVNLLKTLQAKKIDLHAVSHITGGGVENIPRVLPNHLFWQAKDWIWPEPFLEVQRRTKMSQEEMLGTLNCGVGFVLIAPVASREAILSVIQICGFKSYDLGEIGNADKRT